MIDIFKKYDQQHLKNAIAVDSQIKRIYQDLTNKLSVFAVRYRYHESQAQKLKIWFGNESLQKEIDRYLADFSDYIQQKIRGYIAASWELSQNKNDDFVKKILQMSTVSVGGMAVFDLFNRERPKVKTSVLINGTAGKSALSVEAFASLEDVFSMPRRMEGLTAFMNRTVEGMNLSDRVWKLSQQNKTMIEELLSNGIIQGQGAPQIAQTIQSYLQNPDKFFRRVRNPETGELELSANAKAFHPGQGVYRSAYKNARRLALNETNIAYRRADYERWLSNPIITGFDVHLSGSHPMTDLCDDLRGAYPKNFVFTGWHVQCLCNATPIILTDKEMDKYMDSILNGNESLKIRSENTVGSVPESFKQWVVDNSEKAKTWKSLPYFMQDNKQIINKIQ